MEGQIKKTSRQKRNHATKANIENDKKPEERKLSVVKAVRLLTMTWKFYIALANAAV